MRLLLQRVHRARVSVEGKVLGQTARGLLVYAGLDADDPLEIGQEMARKTVNLRIFEDAEGKLNRSLREIDGGVLLVPNFTLVADATQGRRPSFTRAARGDHARRLFESLVSAFAMHCAKTETGSFGEHMEIDSLADGPVNVLLDSRPQ
jgi:D-tyrosyl-tRNA(Tyr) deacylase